jgi:hypothetical protein
LTKALLIALILAAAIYLFGLHAVLMTAVYILGFIFIASVVLTMTAFWSFVLDGR